MHELGIVFYIIRDVKKAAQENGVQKVSAVVMNIGEVSTIVPEYIMDCWRWAADKEDLLRGAELKINTLIFCVEMKLRSKKLKFQTNNLYLFLT